MAVSRRTPSTEAASNGRGASETERIERIAEIQRARIFAAMAEACSVCGAADVTVAQIVSRSGVSRRTFYEQFADRQACLLATLDEAVECARGHVLPAFEGEERWQERMRSSLVALLSFLEDEPFLGRLLVVGSLGAGPAALERRKRVLPYLAAAVDEGRAVSKSTGLPPLTAEGVVGGVLSVIHARLLDRPESLVELAGPLMGMIVLPYLGGAVASRELERPAPLRDKPRTPGPANSLCDLEIRLTYRTVCVLTSIAANPGGSNRVVARAANIDDQGQASRLLTRLTKLGLIENSEAGLVRGGPNSWVLTEKGAEVEAAVGVRTG